jgi:hypothetical protein
MRASDAQARMFELEHHGQSWSGLEYLDWLLGLGGDAPEIELTVLRESERAFLLAEGHYQRVSQRVAVLNPRMIAEVGFIQGATFAAAALGRKPWPADVEDR